MEFEAAVKIYPTQCSSVGGHFVWAARKSARAELCVQTCSLRRDGLEDPLDDAGLVQQQLDQLSTIGRCEYEKTCALLVQLFDQAAQTYQELLQSTNSSTADITVQEGERRAH